MIRRTFLGVEVVKDKETGKLGVFKGGQVKYIKTWRPKKNYCVPGFHLISGDEYSVPLTLETCKHLFSGYNFIPVDTKYLVNPRQVKDISQKRFSGVAIAMFDGAKEIQVPKGRIDLAMTQELREIPLDVEFVGMIVDENGYEVTDDFGTFSLADLCYIDTFEVKSNYKVPRFHTAKGIFTVILKMETCSEMFPTFVKIDSGLLVNIDYVDDVTESQAGASFIRFKDETSVDIPGTKRSMVSQIVNGLAFS